MQDQILAVFTEAYKFHVENRELTIDEELEIMADFLDYRECEEGYKFPPYFKAYLERNIQNARSA